MSLRCVAHRIDETAGDVGRDFRRLADHHVFVTLESFIGKGMIVMNRFALAALIIMTLLNPANALKFAPQGGIPECGPDAVRFCNAVIYDPGKRLACMRAHKSQLSAECLAAIRARQH